MDRQKYKYSELCDEINNMWKEKSTKKVIYLTKFTTCGQTKYKESHLSDQIHNMWIDKVQRESFI